MRYICIHSTENKQYFPQIIIMIEKQTFTVNIKEIHF